MTERTSCSVSCKTNENQFLRGCALQGWCSLSHRRKGWVDPSLPCSAKAFIKLQQSGIFDTLTTLLNVSNKKHGSSPGPEGLKESWNVGRRESLKGNWARKQIGSLYFTQLLIAMTLVGTECLETSIFLFITFEMRSHPDRHRSPPLAAAPQHLERGSDPGTRG